MRKTNTPSWVCSVHVRSNARLLMYHRSPGWTESWLIKLRANGGQRKTAVLRLHETISDSLWILRSQFLFLVGHKIWNWTWSKAKQCQALSTIARRQMLDPEFVHWQVCWVMVQTEAWRKKELHLSEGWKGNGVLHFELPQGQHWKNSCSHRIHG